MTRRWRSLRRVAGNAVRKLASLREDPSGLHGRTYGFDGRYASWAEAESKADGYDAAAILERVAQVTRAAQSRGCFERDGVLFDHPQWNFPFLACLLRVACGRPTTLRVLDVGGSLGTVYTQCRSFLPPAATLQWNIVEQAAFVERGRLEFQTDELRFFPDVRTALAEGPVDLCVLSGVLAYLRAPYGMLAEIASAAIPWLLVDRTPFCEAGEDQISVQRVADSVYGRPISYPAWIFSTHRFRRAIEATWPIIVEVGAIDGRTAVGDLAVDFRLVLAGPASSATYEEHP